MSDARAETLLKSALEKIVYFEARSEQLQSDLAAARAEVDQFKRELTTAATREIDLRRQVAELEVAVQRMHREREEQGRLNDALKNERALLLGKLIESSRISAAGQPPSEDPQFDLASFIAELRSEVLNARALARPNGTPPAHSPWMAQSATPQVSQPAVHSPSALRAVQPPAAQTEVSQHAERLLLEGRLRVSEEELSALASRTGGRTEETLFGFSVRELAAPDPQARIRATERLRALGERAAAPALATALHAETDPVVQVVLLSTFALLAQREGVAVVTPLLESPVSEVRVAALKAVIALDPTQAGPRLASAAQDPDPSVRRRASLLALGLEGDVAAQIELRGSRDGDPDVRRLSALTLGASGSERARGQLLEALRDSDAKVRRAASQSLSRMLGTDCSHVPDMEDAVRRREIRRLATLPVRRSLPPRLQVVPKPTPPPAVSAFASSSKTPLNTPVLTSAPSGGSAAVAYSAPALLHDTEALCVQLMLEVRSAIRGRSLGELAQALRVESDVVEDVCTLLIARAQVVRRGLKYFVA